MIKTGLAVAVVAAACAAAGEPAGGPGGVPLPVVLNAPFTPFFEGNFSLNLGMVPRLADNAAAHGVNTVWVGGGMGQFETMTVDERVALFQAWVREGHRNDLYVIAHVGSNVQAEARAMAAAAEAAGADAVASVPEYYEASDDAQVVVDYLAPVAAAAPKTPFFYYHIPGETRTNIRIAEFLRLAEKEIPTLAGVKYVENNPADFLNCTTTLVDASGGPRFAMLWAPEPKLTSLALGGQGAVLAEDFYAPTYLRMLDAFTRGDMAGARAEQMRKERVMAVFSQFGGGAAERTIYGKWVGADLDLGPPRPPKQAISKAQQASLITALEAVDFFDSFTTPAPSAVPSPPAQ